MFLSTGTEISEHRLHCSASETLVVPSSPLTDEEYREYRLYLDNLTPEQRCEWLAHRRPPITSAPAPTNPQRQFDEYCDVAQANSRTQIVITTQGQEKTL
jgi:hypothetical protein